MLIYTERIVAAYLRHELFGAQPIAAPFSVFATEGATAAMTYVFNGLRANRLIKPGDKIALVTPIFAPYLEIPLLSEYALERVDIRMDEHDEWQLEEVEAAKLLDPAIKLLCLVNPSNPPSTRLTGASLERLASLISTQRPDLCVITDDVYATFADDFESLFARCPYNTICIYSFSKYFGATGWRLAVIALHDENVFDAALGGLGARDQRALALRYESLSAQPQELRFIDRLVADSRAVALNHTAGLSGPQQLQMALFALAGLMDRTHRYNDAAKGLLHDRVRTLYASLGIEAPSGPDRVDYYALLDLTQICDTLHGAAFASWFRSSRLGTDYLLRLASETGVVLLPGKGFEDIEASVRISMANLADIDYVAVGQFTRRVLDEYFEDFARQPLPEPA